LKIMNIALVETGLHWEDIGKNLAGFGKLISDTSSSFELFILPEMFSTGFTMSPEKFGREDLDVVPEWMKKLAGDTNSAIAGSSVALDENGYYNRFYLARPSGQIDHYDKHHLFRMSEEPKHYQAGENRKIFGLAGWRLCPQVCYDLRFPVWSRNCEDYDLLIYVANWPAVRQDAWNTLLKARAIENQCYVAGVNRTGSGPRMAYNGGSVVFSPKGEVISHPYQDHSSILTASPDIHSLQAFREKFPAWMDRDPFILK